MSVLLIILGFLFFVGLVIVHEWGHFIAARRAGVEVEEFGVGFPPKVWGKQIKTKKSKFLLSINLLPLGGFVRLKGENDAATSQGSYGVASLKDKTKILVAGVGMNLLAAYVLLVIVALIGMPQIVPDQFGVARDSKVTRQVENKGKVTVARVVGGSPAEKAGINRGDLVQLINGNKITSPTQVSDITKEYAGRAVEIKLQRGNEVLVKTVQLNKVNTGDGFLGVSGQSDQKGVELRRSTWSAPIVAAGVLKQFTVLTFNGLGSIVSNVFSGHASKAGDQVAGPVGIAVVIKEGSKIGVQFILMIIAIISLSLAIMNILPIPALDGGRLFVTYLFRLNNWKLTKEKESVIHGAGFAFLMTLFVLITVLDVKRFF